MLSLSCAVREDDQDEPKAGVWCFKKNERVCVSCCCEI